MYSTIQGRNIWYTDNGKGFPVVLVHGYLESSEIWNGFSESLASSGFRVIAIDLPGHGRSEVYSETHSMEMMAGIIRELLENLGLGKVFLIGHSLGGYVTLAFLDLYPDLLSGYCLFHSHPLPDSPEVVLNRKKTIATVLAGKKDLIVPDSIERMFASLNLKKFDDAVKRSKRIASTIPETGIIAILKGMIQRPSRVAVMEEGRVPCLWMLGMMDNYIDYGVIREKVKLPGNAKIILLTNSGHMGFVEEEEQSVETVTEFINKSIKSESL